MPAESSPAVFLSYARDDAAAARRIAEALRASGLEVWFDENELRGGDAWDAKIRKQINDCTLFVALISQHTEARAKGYFRLEWKLAVEQTHMLLEGVPFLVPVVVDETGEGSAAVPPEFLRVQWTRLAGALPTPQFVAQIKRLLEAPRSASITRPAFRVVAPVENLAPAPVATSNKIPLFAITAIAMVAIAAAIFFALRPAAKDAASASSGVGQVSDLTHSKPGPAVPKISDKSVAVLPFANLSTEKENEFFADGVQDDVITNLSKIRDLTVISRTSTLAYRDPASRNLKKIGTELGVATILEGSVRRVGTKVHMNAQLIDARTDAHLWADTFDGDASDIFALQADLSKKIAAALKATLTPGERTLIERRPTENQEAYELYSRAELLKEALSPNSRRSDYEPIIALYEQAVAKDPGFALAFAHLSALHGLMYWFTGVDATAERRAHAEAALAAARRIAPDAPETHYAQGEFAYRCNNDWQGALADYGMAEPGMPNDAELQMVIGYVHRRLLNLPEAVRRFERSVALNPRDLNGVIALAETPLVMRRYAQAKTLAAQNLTVFPGERRLRGVLIAAQYELDGDYPAFNRARAEMGVTGVDPFGLGLAYRTALLTRDLSAAERILADSRLDPNVLQDASYLLFPSSGAYVDAGGLDSRARHRALVAFLLGKREAAAQFADELIASFRQANPTPRQKPGALLAIADVEAYAGRADEAIRDGRAALSLVHADDEYEALRSEMRFATIQLVLDRRDDALASLRRLVSQPRVLPQALRTDPIWSRLKDDPRFEEILKSAKVF